MLGVWNLFLNLILEGDQSENDTVLINQDINCWLGGTHI
jgi:hypothetical protein